MRTLFSAALIATLVVAGDAQAQANWPQRQVTIVMATPVPELVEEVSDRIAILKEGRLLAFGTLDDLRKQSGSTGHLDDVYERIASPSSAEKIDQYFRGTLS